MSYSASEHYETGQLRALVEDYQSAKLASEQTETASMPAILSNYDESERSGLSSLVAAITESIGMIVPSRSVSCEFNGHKLPRKWAGEFPRCEHCNRKIKSYDEVGPVHQKPQHSGGRYWIR